MHPDEIFEAIFGTHHGFTWSHISWEDFHFRNRSFRFRWSGGESHRERIPSDDEDESEEDSRETTSVGSHAHRVILGLPPCGPLTLEDVKTAYVVLLLWFFKLLLVCCYCYFVQDAPHTVVHLTYRCGMHFPGIFSAVAA